MVNLTDAYDMQGSETTWTNSGDGTYDIDWCKCTVSEVIYDHKDEHHLSKFEPHNYPMLILKPVMTPTITINAYCEEVADHPFIEIYCHGTREGMKAVESQNDESLKIDSRKFLADKSSEYSPYTKDSQADKIFKIGFECAHYKF